MKKVNLLSRAEMKNVLGGVAPVGGASCYASCKDKDNVVLNEESLIVESCGSVSLAACKAEYPATTQSGCFCD